MDANLVNPFIAAAVDILQKVGNVSPAVGKPFLKTDTRAKGAVSGIVTLEGVVRGSVALTFADACILAIVSAMFGEEVSAIDDDVKDAVGEITNMICGQATQLYTQAGTSLKASLQQVLMGAGHAVPHLPDRAVLGVPMQTDGGEIVVEFCLDEKK